MLPKSTIASDIDGLLVSPSPSNLAPRSRRCAKSLKTEEESADVIFGAAILHHLIEPGKFSGSPLRVLKPGSWAFFFELLEGGLAVLRLIWEARTRACL
jgi:hypothetical protein